MVGLAVAACGSTNTGPAGAATRSHAAGALVVAADDSLAAAFAVIQPAYEAATPGAKLTLRFGPSSGLRATIEGGAAIDLFFADDLATARAIATERLAAGPVVPFVVTQSGATSGVVILARSADVPGAASFVRWLGEADGRAILERFGLARPPGP